MGTTITKKNKKASIMCIIALCLPFLFGFSDSEIANAIYKAENSKKYPYGIKSINTHSNKEYARKICLNTIRNNRKRFNKQKKYKEFIEFLGSRYCPPKAHKLNKNWVKNVKYYLTQQEKH